MCLTAACCEGSINGCMETLSDDSEPNCNASCPVPEDGVAAVDVGCGTVEERLLLALIRSE